jgi:hypothetical protein
MALMNSKLLNYWYRKCVLDVSIRVVDLAKVPIHNIDFKSKDGKALHDKMVSLVESMLELHKKLSAAKTPNEKTVLQRQIDSTDEQIDRLVYELYGLTEEEIQIVEGAGK